MREILRQNAVSYSWKSWGKVTTTNTAT